MLCGRLSCSYLSTFERTLIYLYRIVSYRLVQAASFNERNAFLVAFQVL